jgi:hypothetical protein
MPIYTHHTLAPHLARVANSAVYVEALIMHDFFKKGRTVWIVRAAAAGAAANILCSVVAPPVRPQPVGRRCM